MTAITVEPDPPPVNVTEGSYNSLYFDPAHYDTAAVTFVVEEDPALAEET